MIKPLFFFSTAGHFLNQFSIWTNGVDDYIDYGNILNFERTDPFSASFWFKTTSGTGCFMGRRLDATAFKGWSINNNSGQIGFNLSSNNVTTNRIVVRTVAATYDNGVWYHAVVTYDGASLGDGVKIYVNGVNKAVTKVIDNLTGSILNNADFNLAARTNGINPYLGYLDEPAIFDTVLSSAQVTAIYNLGNPQDLSRLDSFSNLILWSRFTREDKNNFPTILDHSDSGFNGTAINMAETAIQGDTP